jgi:hypothetical protein
MSSSIPQRHSPQFTPAPLPIPTRRPTHRANRSLSSSDDGSLDTQSSTNTNTHLMTQYPYQDSDEDPLRHAYIPIPLSFSPAHLISGLYAMQSMSQRPRLAALVVSRKPINSPSSIAPLPSFPHTSSPFTTLLFRTQTRYLRSSPSTSRPSRSNSARISRTRATTHQRVMSMFHLHPHSLQLRWGVPYRSPLQ